MRALKEGGRRLDFDRRSSAPSWWRLLIPTLLAVSGAALRPDNGQPWFSNTWFESAVIALRGMEPEGHDLVPLMDVWGWSAVVGTAASLYVISVGSWKPDGTWRLVRLFCLGTVPFVVVTAVPLFIWPLAAGGVLCVPMGSAASIACAFKTLDLGLRPTADGLLRMCQMIAWFSLVLVFLSWLDVLITWGMILLMGGS